MHVVTEGEDIGEVLVDGGSSDISDSWCGVEDGVIVGDKVTGGACDRDAVDGGMEGAGCDMLVEDILGVVSEGRILAEVDGDDVGTVVNGGLEAHEVSGGGALRQPADLVGGDACPHRFWRYRYCSRRG